MPTSEAPALVWFRDDLRVADNPALTRAVSSGRPVVALYVLDEVSPGIRSPGGARRWWLHHSLTALAADLARLGIALVLRRGAAGAIVPALATALGAGLVTWNRRYRAAEIELDRAVKAELAAKGHAPESFQAHLLHEPWSVRSKVDEPFRVFTPFWRSACAGAEPRAPLPAPARVHGLQAAPASDRLEDWALTPTRPDWSGGIAAAWTPGEAGAAARLRTFLDDEFAGYAEQRDRPDLPSTSRLSPHLAFGEISPFQIRQAACHAVESGRSAASRRDLDKFLAELGWREFSYHLLGQFPDMERQNIQPRFDAFPWQPDPVLLSAWQRGRTGIPMVDAGMRQLWQTGWMHNRVRMICGSFLVKHLLQDWRAGEAWFHDTLVDADPASNPASWQWVAGSGADAAPYFRVFNPVLQGEKFDPDGAYVRRFVPELAGLPSTYLHAPWTAPAALLAAAGIRLGSTYPRPVVDVAAGRDRALAAFDQLKSSQSAA
jgi:deoxyribodipyrimidine photo-lyase